MKQAAYLTRREIIIAGVCVTVVFFWIVYAVAWRPLIENKEKSTRQIVLLRKKLARDRERVALQGGLDTRWRKALDFFGEKSGSASEGAGLITAIEAAAAAVNVKIGDVQPQIPSETVDFNRYVIRVTVNAPLAEVLSFIHAMQGAPYYAEVSELHIQRYQTGSNVLTAEIAFSFTRLRAKI